MDPEIVHGQRQPPAAMIHLVEHSQRRNSEPRWVHQPEHTMALIGGRGHVPVPALARGSARLPDHKMAIGRTLAVGRSSVAVPGRPDRKLLDSLEKAPVRALAQGMGRPRW